MTSITSLFGRTALAAAAVMSGAALLISCAGTLDDIDKYRDGDDTGAGAGDVDNPTGSPAAGAGGAPPAAGAGGDPTTTGNPAVTTGMDPTTTGNPAVTTGMDPTTTGAGPSCPDVPSLLTQRCATTGCHDSSRQAGLSLETGWETMVQNRPSSCGGGSMLLVPGNPEMSSIYTKVTPNPPCNQRMPLGTAYFEEPELNCIRDWIAGL